MSGGPEEIVIIAIDPGTHKCGAALLTAEGEVGLKEIVPRGGIVEKVKAWRQKHPDARVAVGGSTQGKDVTQELASEADISAVEVDEADTTDEARELFWKENRPGCFWGIFPSTFRPMPRPIDDYAAVIIGRRFLADSAGSADKRQL
jgi:RNase H-fold protein (predicted Holliday junction resolvase)